MTEKQLVAVDHKDHQRMGCCPYCGEEVQSVSKPVLARITCTHSNCGQPFLVIDAAMLRNPKKLANLPGCKSGEIFGCQVLICEGSLQIRHPRGTVVEVYTWEKPPRQAARQKQQVVVA